MTTQIIFKIEEKLKKAAQKKAKEEGVTLSEFYKSATRSFVEGRLNVGLNVRPEEDDWSYYTKESLASFKRGLKDMKNGKIHRIA